MGLVGWFADVSPKAPKWVQAPAANIPGVPPPPEGGVPLLPGHAPPAAPAGAPPPLPSVGEEAGTAAEEAANGEKAGDSGPAEGDAR